jgi:hypothetical protein
MKVLDVLPLFFGEGRNFKLRTFELEAFGLLTSRERVGDDSRFIVALGWKSERRGSVNGTR